MKRLVLSSLLVPMVVLCAAEARADCVFVRSGKFGNISSMEYDTAVGVKLHLHQDLASFIGRVPKLVNGQPNPDFDRIYGLLLKAFPTRTISSVCLSGTAKDGATLDITSVEVEAEDVGLQKVTVCDPSGNYCASVGNDRALNTSK